MMTKTNPARSAFNSRFSISTINYRYLLPSFGSALRISLSCLFSAMAFGLAAQSFSNGSIHPLEGVSHSAMAWADYDNDNDPDLLITGETDLSGAAATILYRNDGHGKFSALTAGLPAVSNGAVAWADYDNDNDLDLLLSGYSPAEGVITRIYENKGTHTFERLPVVLPGVTGGNVSWGDADNDGDPDILLAGSQIAEIYLNDGQQQFFKSPVTLPGIESGYANWVDVDNDDDLDVFISGTPDVFEYGAEFSKIYLNLGDGAFQESTAVLPGMISGTADWGDYDNDGDADLLLTGGTQDNMVGLSAIYKNSGNGNFQPVPAALAPMLESAAAWGDADNDGDLDILMAGNAEDPENAGVFYAVTRVYKNLGNDSFSLLSTRTLQGVSSGKVNWADYDKDGDLDLTVTGYNGLKPTTRIYKNNLGPANKVPAAPQQLQATVKHHDVVLQWAAAQDTQTPATGLSYNIYVSRLVPPHSDISTGYRRVIAVGNAGQGTRHLLKHLPPGTYQWKVQAIDHHFAGSPFSLADTFTVSELSVRPSISSFHPAVATAGMEIIIRGHHLNEVRGVYFNDVAAAGFKVINSQTISAVVPAQAVSGKIRLQTVGGAVVSGRELIILPCGSPSGLAVGKVEHASGVLYWQGSGETQKYQLRYRGVGEAAWRTIYTDQTEVTLKHLKAGMSYEWQVKGICREGLSNYYVAGPSFATLACEPPAFLNTADINPHSATLQWQRVENARYYLVRYRRAGNKAWQSSMTSQTYFALNDLSAGQAYEWMVNAHCGNGGASVYSASLIFYTAVPAGQLSQLPGVVFHLYPNPASERLHLNVQLEDTEKQMEIYIYDMRGLTVYSRHAKGSLVEQLDIAGRRGVYLARVIVEGRIFTEKFMIE